MGIVRYAVECPGCKSGIVLSLGVGHEKRQSFFYVCPKCCAATKGALIWNGGAHTRLEIADGRKLRSEQNCTEVVSINPEIPAFAGARSMAEQGGSAFITFFQWLGADGIQSYQAAFYQMRHLIDADWKRLSRLSTYYLNHDARHFDETLKALLPAGQRLPTADWERDHIVHYFYEIFFAPVWALHPERYFMEMTTAWNALWSSDRPYYKEMVSFARDEANSTAFINTQRDLFEQIGRYVDLMAAMLPGLLCDLLPKEHQSQVDQLRLFRDEYELLRDLYIQAFETSHKVLRWVVGGANVDSHGDPSKFVPVGGMNPALVKHPPKNLDVFTRSASAAKREWLALLPEWHTRWDALLDRHLRNDIGHASARHQLSTGLIQRDSGSPLAYTRFVQKTQRIIHPLLACANVLKIMRIYATIESQHGQIRLTYGKIHLWKRLQFPPRARSPSRSRFGKLSISKKARSSRSKSVGMRSCFPRAMPGESLRALPLTCPT